MSGFFTTFEISEARRDMAQTLGPCTLEIIRQEDSESDTGGPDLADVALRDGGGKSLRIPYRIRPLRTPRTKVEGDQTIVVADWELLSVTRAVRMRWPRFAVVGIHEME